MKRPRGAGFTLIEVTLAMVIGVIMVAGATLIYNQAKVAAGNSRAQAKVIALQGLVEEYAAMTYGIYPDSLVSLNALWQRKRPDDWNKSPWGGMIGTAFNPANPVTGIGVTRTSDANQGSANLGTTNPDAAGTPRVGNGDTTVPLGYRTSPAGTNTGVLVYDVDTTNATFSYAVDIMTNRSATVKGYGVHIADQLGRFPNFVKGGRPN